MALQLMQQEQSYLTKSLSKTHILLQALRAELVDIDRSLQEDQPRPKKRRTKHSRWKTKRAVENCENEQQVLLEALRVCEAKISAAQQSMASYRQRPSTILWSPTFPVEMTLPVNGFGHASLSVPLEAPSHACGLRFGHGEPMASQCNNLLFTQPIYGPPTSTYVSPHALLYSPPDYSYLTPSMVTQYPEELLSPSAPSFGAEPPRVRFEEESSPPTRRKSSLSAEAPIFKPTSFVLAHRRKESVPISPFTQPQISPFIPQSPQRHDSAESYEKPAELPEEQRQSRRYSAGAVDLILSRLAAKGGTVKRHRRNQSSTMTVSSLASVEEVSKVTWGSMVEYEETNHEAMLFPHEQ